MTQEFSGVDALYDRLSFAYESNKDIIFIVGSPLTSPVSPDNKGVLGVEGVIDLIRNEFRRNHTADEKLEKVLRSAGQQSYQSAFEFLISRRGPDFANYVVRKAVINAYINNKNIDLNDLDSLEDAEKDIDSWHLTPGVLSLGELLAKSPRKSFHTVLTTNFDPLIQIAIARAKGTSFTTMLHREGNLLQTRADAAHIVHLHGSWRGSDTLHTVRQLAQQRSQLRSSLATIARKSLLVVVGYGGWDDIITSTLAELVLDDTSSPEIAWTFFSSSQEDIEVQHSALLEKLNVGISRGRVSLYSGVNCHEFFPGLFDVLGAIEPGDQTGLPKLTLEEQKLVSLLDDAPLKSEPINAVPKSEIWFGRDEESAKLETSNSKAIAITGIGGQGKSTLASNFFEREKIKNGRGFFDWKDCREQGNTINLALCSLIEKSTSGTIKIAEISKRTIAELITILLRETRSIRGMIVFDNVDHYVDLENNEPLGPLKIVIDEILKHTTNIIFVFTARPIIRVEHADFLELRLYGLERPAAKELFEYRYRQKIDPELFQKLYEFTAGHPLWLNIVAAQCYSKNKKIETVLSEINTQNIGIDLPKQMLRQTWILLNANQQHVLRTLAELERPETEKVIEEITDLNFNKLNKALTNLKSMCLVERKVTQDKEEVIDLHPLIRQFVRGEFAKHDRESFIVKVLVYLDRRIFHFRNSSNSAIPHLVLEMWVHKIDLLINGGLISQAVDSLMEIETRLNNHGLNEEISRLAKRIFGGIDWLSAVTMYGNFDKLFNVSMRSIIEVEGSEEAEPWLLKYEQSIAGKGAQYINLCDIQAYKFWYDKEFEDSILWAQRGENLKKSSNVETVFQCDHTLALSQRDSGQIEPAYEFFRDGLTETQIFSSESIETRPGQFFGNIGRCFFLLGSIEKAIASYKVSATKLDNGNSSAIDQGYIRYWAGQAMLEKGRREDAYCFFRAAVEKLEKVAPTLAEDVLFEMADLTTKYADLASVSLSPQWKYENRFSQWISEK